MPEPNMETIQPAFTVRIISGQVFLDWNWGGNGDFLDLTYDTTPG